MKDIVQRLKALGLKEPLAVKLESLVSKWAQSSGPEWTVKRLKSLKTEFLQTVADATVVKTPWVRRNSEGLPSGPIAELFRIGRSSARGRFICINAFMIYSSYISQKATESQKRKFFGSMESTDRTGLDITPRRTFKVGETGYIPGGVPWTNANLSQDKFQPGPDGKSYPESDPFISLAAAVSSRAIMQIVRKYSPLFNEVVPVRLLQDMWSEGTIAMKYANPLVSLCVGKISYIQEPGFKLRAVANPNRIIQSALEPLKSVLRDVISGLPNDFTFDQGAGVLWVQNQLKEGRTVSSIDLSDATNLFPLGYTVSVLRKRIRVSKESDQGRYSSLVGLFHDVSCSPWFSKEEGVITTHRFTRGQPLGLGPSFFAFGISHNVLLMDLCMDIGIKSDFPFAVLGDDVVISDSRLSAAYVTKLHELGCKVAYEKTITSKVLAEFAGKVIFRDSVVPQFKWREISDQNCVDFCRNIGPASLSLLSTRQRHLIDAISEVPDLLGGMGWNPMGLPLDERLSMPLARFLFERDLTVYLPYRRVDVTLRKLNADVRIREVSPVYLTYSSESKLIPTRDGTHPGWGTRRFWRGYLAAVNAASLPPDLQAFDDADQRNALVARLSPNSQARFKDLYTPYFKDDQDPTKRERVPWFDIVRYFERSQSRLESIA